MVVEYRPLPGFTGYRVGDDGSIWSRKLIGPSGQLGKRWRKLRPAKGPDGYLKVTLSCAGRQRTKNVHSLILLAFVGARPQGGCCCHHNGLRDDNRLTNLTWGTYRKNNGNDRLRHGTHLEGSRCNWAKLTDEQVLEIRQKYATGNYRQLDLAILYGVRQPLISQIIRHVSWKHLS